MSNLVPGRGIRDGSCVFVLTYGSEGHGGGQDECLFHFLYGGGLQVIFIVLFTIINKKLLF